MAQPDRLLRSVASPRELPWWTRPSTLNLLFVLPVLLLVLWAGRSEFSGLQVRSRDYLSAPYIALFVGLILVSAVGAWLGENVRQHTLLRSPDQHLVRAAIWVGVLVIATYLFWFRSLIANPALIMAGVKLDRTASVVTGITSLVNLAPLFFSLAGYLLFVRKVRDGTLAALTVVLLLFTFFRAYVWSERLAVVDAFIPLALAILGSAGPQPHQRVRRLFWRLGPYAALPAVFLFFAAAEFFRSWAYYADQMEFWEFALGRFVSYYYTALNNGAGMLTTTEKWPTGTFDQVLSWLHAFPLGIGPWFSEMVGHTNVGLAFLERFADPEFNSSSSFAAVTLDLGVAGAALYFFLCMFCAGILYSRYVQGDTLAVMLYPSAIMLLFESFRYAYWGTSRAFVWLLGSLVVLAVLWISGAIGAAAPTNNAHRPATS